MSTLVNERGRCVHSSGPSYTGFVIHPLIHYSKLWNSEQTSQQLLGQKRQLVSVFAHFSGARAYYWCTDDLYVHCIILAMCTSNFYTRKVIRTTIFQKWPIFNGILCHLNIDIFGQYFTKSCACTKSFTQSSTITYC